MRRKRIAIAGASFALLALAYFGPSTYRKSQMDAEVERLCAKYGGVKVYQRAELPASMFSSRGEAQVPRKNDLQKSVMPYTLEYRSTPIVKGSTYGSWSPTLQRHERRIVRTIDGFVHGEVIGFSRFGGDPAGPWAQSAYSGSCMSAYSELERAVFTNWVDRR